MYPDFDLPNLIMVYLLAVMLTAVQCGRGPAILRTRSSACWLSISALCRRDGSSTVEDARLRRHIHG
jgi:K+-sensing histidine kinase KdpD